MYYTLVSNITNLEYNEITEKMIECADDVINYAEEPIMEFVDSILERFWKSPKGIGVFSEHELYNEVKTYATEEIDRIKGDLYFTSYEFDDIRQWTMVMKKVNRYDGYSWPVFFSVQG